MDKSKSKSKQALSRMIVSFVLFLFNRNSTKKMLMEALAIENGMPIKESRNVRLAAGLVGMAAMRWMAEMVTGGDSRLQKKLHEFDMEMVWAEDAFDLRWDYTPLRDPKAHYDLWWEFIRDDTYFNEMLDLIAQGPKVWKRLGVEEFFGTTPDDDSLQERPTTTSDDEDDGLPLFPREDIDFSCAFSGIPYPREKK